MAVNPSVPAKTVPEFIAYAKANPGKINMASAGIGTAHPCCRRAVQDAGRRPDGHVPYRGGGPALADLVGGQVQVMFGSMPSMIGYVRAGTCAAGGDDAHALGRAAGHADRRRVRARATRRPISTGSARRRIRLPKSSRSSTVR